MVVKVGSSFETTWRGLAAVYTALEREAIAPLPVSEQWILHQLKAHFGGEIHPDETSRSPKPKSPKLTGDHRLDASVERNHSPRVYIDAEDIPFGDAPVRRPKPLYALQWTRGRGSVHKTKKQATRRMRAWKNWKVRQGWKVINHPTGFFAGKDNVREAVLIREIRKAPEGASLF